MLEVFREGLGAQEVSQLRLEFRGAGVSEDDAATVDHADGRLGVREYYLVVYGGPALEEGGEGVGGLRGFVRFGDYVPLEGVFEQVRDRAVVEGQGRVRGGRGRRGHEGGEHRFARKDIREGFVLDVVIANVGMVEEEV